jgi:hypothetical protein
MVDYDPRDEWTEKQIETKVQTAVKAGMLEPFDGEESFRAMAAVHQRYFDNPELHAAVEELLIEEEAKRKSQETDPEVVPMHGPTQEPPRQDRPRPADPAPEQQKQSKHRMFPDVLDAGDDIDPPSPREWLLGNVFCREFLSSLFGDGGVGKTALRYAQYMSLALGRPLTDEHIFQRCRILIISLEDSDKELRRRIWALRLH